MFHGAMGDQFQKVVLTLGVGSLIAMVTGYLKVNGMVSIDLWACSVLLTAWVIYLLPGLMDRLNISLVKDIFVILFKLWTVDLAFSCFALLRGYGNGNTYVMDDGWFYTTTGFMRTAVVVSCLVVSTISYVTKQIQRERSKRLILSRLKEK